MYLSICVYLYVFVCIYMYLCVCVECGVQYIIEQGKGTTKSPRTNIWQKWRYLFCTSSFICICKEEIRKDLTIIKHGERKKKGRIALENTQNTKHKKQPVKHPLYFLCSSFSAFLTIAIPFFLSPYYE